MSNIKNILLFITGITAAFFTVSLIKLFLPSYPVIYTSAESNSMFFNINLQKIFLPEHKSVIKKSTPEIKATLKGVVLKATYNNGKKSFIIIEHKSKTVFVDLNKKYNGYKLIKINPRSAIFEKNGSRYILKFKNSDKPQTHYRKIKKTNTFVLKKSTVMEYKNDPAKIWNNIGIVKYNRGYKITYIKPGSIFDKIGLKKGDIILQVNNRELSNDAQAWKLYNNIGKFNSLDIEIERNNRLKVIHYEMD